MRLPAHSSTGGEVSFESVKQATSLQEYMEAHLKKVPGGFVCPLCRSGEGPKATPAFKLAPGGNRWKCFSCNESGDIFDLAGVIHDTQDKREQLRAVAEWAGVPVEEEPGRATVKAAIQHPKAAPEYGEGRRRAAAYLMEARSNLAHPDAVSYLTGRGISLEKARAWGFGFDPNAGGAKDAGGNWCRRGRIIMPWRGAPWYYVGRSIAPDVAEGKYNKPSAKDVGKQPLYNPDALNAGALPFLVEGVLDALAVEECGYPAIALGGTGWRETLGAIYSRGYRGRLALLLDADSAGENAAEQAEAFARSKGLHTYRANLAEQVAGCKDAFEAYVKDAEALRNALGYFTQAAQEEAAKEAETAQEEAGDTLNAQDPAQIAAAIWARQGEEVPTPTGFPELDKAMNGGLRSGLTILGAISSAGKTTLFTQICDNIAAQGRPCLFVSCEQSGRELVAKSLSRGMARRGYKDVTRWEMTGKYRDNWPDEKEAAFLGVLEEYCDLIAPRVTIYQPDKQPTVADIAQAAEAIEAETGQAPCVFIDFIQLLAPLNPRATDKQNVDTNLNALRSGIGRRMPVLAISSLNRDSYSGDIEMKSFKESGSLEYSADMLLGLQPRNMRTRVEGRGGLSESQQKHNARDVTEEFRREAVKECEVTILKNRNGRLPENPLPFTFYAASSLFEEC